jgi:hypothetical protein
VCYEVFSDSFYSFLLYYSHFTAYTQNPEWIIYNKCDDVNSIVSDGEYIWSGTDIGLILINKHNDEKIMTLMKLSGKL